MVPGAACSEESESARQAMDLIWSKKEVVVFVDVTDSSSTVVNNSALNIPMAVIGMHHLERFGEHVEGRDIMYICAYNAQLDLVKCMVKDLVKHLQLENKHALADQVSRVQFTTIDSSMGKDRKHTIVDYSGSDGFSFEDARTLVALTRVKVSTVIIGDIGQLMSKKKVGPHNTLREIAEYLFRSKAIVEVGKRDRVA